MLKVQLSKFLCVSLLTSTCLVQAKSLKDMVSNINTNNTQLKSIKYNNKASLKSINKTESLYKPTIDLDIVGERKQVKIKPDNNPINTVNHTGYNAKIKLEQLLWDGGLSSSKISESKYSHQLNLLNNKVKSDEMLLEGITTYFEVLKYTRRVELANENVTKNKEHLKIAMENEKLTNEALETYQAKAKLHLANKIRLDEIEGLDIAKNKYKRITNMNATNLSMPSINNKLVPDTLESFIKIVLNYNNDIKAQNQNILKQDALVAQKSSSLKPSIKFNLSVDHDDDLLVKDTVQDNYSAKVILKYNLYNGEAGTTSSKIEKIYLKEEKAKLETTVNSIIEKASSEYSTYTNSTKRINELKNYVSENNNIFVIYQSQFEGGTKTFSDILDAWTDVYNAKKMLGDEYIIMNESYFNLLKISSQLNKI